MAQTYDVMPTLIPIDKVLTIDSKTLHEWKILIWLKL